MDHRTMIKLLEECKGPLLVSAEKWKDISRGLGGENGMQNCACCHEYYNEGSCGECPINKANNDGGCNNKEYRDFNRHITMCDVCDNVIGVYCETGKRLAEKEYDFLMKLYSKLKKERTENKEGFLDGNTL